MNYNTPSDLVKEINEYTKPICRVDWRENPSPSCLAIYKSDYYRDYRCDILFKSYLRYGRDREDIDEDTTWDYWCYWRGVLKTEEHKKNGPSSAERGVNRDYCKNNSGWWRDIWDRRRIRVGTLNENWTNY